MSKTNFVKSYKLKKNSEKEIEMKRKDFIKEHKNLINVLESPSHKDDKKEAKKQKKELKEYTKKSETATYDFKDSQSTVNAQLHVSSEQSASPELIQYLTASINAEVSKIRLAKGTLTLSKKEDGLYCGFFQDMQGQVTHQFENMTIPILAKNLQVKELYDAPPQPSHADAEEDEEMIENAMEMHEALYHRGQEAGQPIGNSEGYVRIKYGDFELEIKKSMSDFVRSFKNSTASKNEVQKALTAWRRNSNLAKNFRTDLEAAQALLADWATHGEDFNQILFAIKMKHER